MNPLILCIILSPISLGGIVRKTGEIGLTQEQVDYFLGLPEPPIAVPNAAVETSESVTLDEIVEAIGLVGEEDFTQGGVPKADALEKLLGQPVSAADRDTAWKLFLAAQEAK